MMTGGGAEKTVGSLGGGCGDWRGGGGLSHDLNSPVWKSPYFLFFLLYPFISPIAHSQTPQQQTSAQLAHVHYGQYCTITTNQRDQ